MNCEKCGKEDSTLKVGLSYKTVCYECSKLHRQMTETLRLEYVEKLKESEDFFFNSAKEDSPVITTFVDDEELYESKPEVLEPPAPEEIDSLPQELFG